MISKGVCAQNVSLIFYVQKFTIVNVLGMRHSL